MSEAKATHEYTAGGLAAALEQLGIAPDRPLGKEVFVGLPMPEQVWDDTEAA